MIGASCESLFAYKTSVQRVPASPFTSAIRPGVCARIRQRDALVRGDGMSVSSWLVSSVIDVACRREATGNNKTIIVSCRPRSPRGDEQQPCRSLRGESGTPVESGREKHRCRRGIGLRPRSHQLPTRQSCVRANKASGNVNVGARLSPSRSPGFSFSTSTVEPG